MDHSHLTTQRRDAVTEHDFRAGRVQQSVQGLFGGLLCEEARDGIAVVGYQQPGGLKVVSRLGQPTGTFGRRVTAHRRRRPCRRTWLTNRPSLSNSCGVDEQVERLARSEGMPKCQRALHAVKLGALHDHKVDVAVGVHTSVLPRRRSDHPDCSMSWISSRAASRRSASSDSRERMASASTHTTVPYAGSSTAANTSSQLLPVLPTGSCFSRLPEVGDQRPSLWCRRVAMLCHGGPCPPPVRTPSVTHGSCRARAVSCGPPGDRGR